MSDDVTPEEWDSTAKDIFAQVQPFAEQLRFEQETMLDMIACLACIYGKYLASEEE